MNKRYAETVWTMLDDDAAWPTLPENINPEPGHPEAYFAECIRDSINETRRALAELETALITPGWAEAECDALERMREAFAGIEVAVSGRVILARAAEADATHA